MAIRGDSFSSAAEVLAYTRHLLDGQSTFNSTTRPTLTELEKFIDRTSGVLNIAFSEAGFTPSNIYGNSTAKLMADDWVTLRAAQYTELTQRGTGFGELEGSRLQDLGLYQDAVNFAKSVSLGLKRLGITVTDNASDGLTFTAFDKHSQRADPDNTSLEQPKFRRGMFDSPGTVQDGATGEDED